MARNKHIDLIKVFAVDFLFIVTPIVGVCNCSLFCCTLLYVHFSFAIILKGKRELVALLSLSFWCLVMIVWLFLAMPWVCLRFMIVAFPDHTHYFCQIFLSCLFERTLESHYQNMSKNGRNVIVEFLVSLLNIRKTAPAPWWPCFSIHQINLSNLSRGSPKDHLCQIKFKFGQ